LSSLGKSVAGLSDPRSASGLWTPVVILFAAAGHNLLNYNLFRRYPAF
jgi:hypothetical protein